MIGVNRAQPTATPGPGRSGVPVGLQFAGWTGGTTFPGSSCPRCGRPSSIGRSQQPAHRPAAAVRGATAMATVAIPAVVIRLVGPDHRGQQTEGCRPHRKRNMFMRFTPFAVTCFQEPLTRKPQARCGNVIHLTCGLATAAGILACVQEKHATWLVLCKRHGGLLSTSAVRI